MVCVCVCVCVCARARVCIVSSVPTDSLLFKTHVKANRVPVEPFKSQWIFYAPASLTLNNSTFCPQRTAVFRMHLQNKHRLFLRTIAE
jgi:hypothetical protein